jgi:hypothetical protein
MAGGSLFPEDAAGPEDATEARTQHQNMGAAAEQWHSTKGRHVLGRFRFDQEVQVCEIISPMPLNSANPPGSAEPMLDARSQLQEIGLPRSLSVFSMLMVSWQA